MYVTGTFLVWGWSPVFIAVNHAKSLAVFENEAQRPNDYQRAGGLTLKEIMTITYATELNLKIFTSHFIVPNISIPVTPVFLLVTLRLTK